MKAGRQSSAGDWAFPDPADPARTVSWTGEAFDVGARSVRVLEYQVSPSGWTDELTHLHEETGGSDHFIDVASRRHAVSEVERCAPPPGGAVLEIGVSSGFLLRQLLDRLPDRRVFGADYTRDTLESLAPKVPRTPLLQFDLTQCPLGDATVDVSVVLNVLEHIEDDVAAVRHLYRITRPGGAVVIELPAASSLYDVFDRVLMHHRRYDMAGLLKLVTAAGFLVERKSHLGFLLFPMFYLAKRLNQLRYGSGKAFDDAALVAEMIAATRKTGGPMGLVMKVESGLRRLIYLPFGVRCLVTCRKPFVRMDAPDGH